MLFHTFKFLIFFVLFFAVYWALRRHTWRMRWLLLGSVVFYMSWIPWHICLILFSAGVDYFMAQRIEETQSPRLKRCFLVLSIGTNLGLLMFFKYFNFFLSNVEATLAPLGLSVATLRLDLILPLGISFYTFETISYIVDVYLGKTRAVRSALDYALYIMFFPHLVAGPIVRPYDFLPQLRRPKRFSWQRMQVGAQLFTMGLFKKAIVADHLATLVDPVFAAPGQFSSAAIWLGVLAYAGQIYCDFSGYSDMALGLAHTLGFHLPLNFNMPYFAASITEFWQRWHISLSTWLRDYLYIPLGGNRGGTFLTCRNLMITMLLGGLWHGASWTFLIWGFYHGLLLVLHRLIPWPAWLAHSWTRPLRMATTFLCVAIGWVFFRAISLEAALEILRRMFQPMAGLPLEPVLWATGCTLLALLFSMHLVATLWPVARWRTRIPAPVFGVVLGLLLVTALVLFPATEKAFIYFQF
ncbi:MAG TPA: MBOAT family O-acyltransferase [Gemmatales bacterium]|nr:MBOAT family O-acyltransferase [Gemmatales bacterium]HMP58971.1 MBOAT family O-acyltransferase [Gemmatales bacterium]